VTTRDGPGHGFKLQNPRLPASTFGTHSSTVRYWQSQYTVPAPMFITAHQGASPKAWLGEVPNDVAAARPAIPNVSFASVFSTTSPPWVSYIFLNKHRNGKTNPDPYATACHVRDGSISAEITCPRHVRYAPDSDRIVDIAQRRRRAKRRHPP